MARGWQASVGLEWPNRPDFIQFGEEDLDRSIIDHFERVARRHPDRIAIMDSDTFHSFAQL
jgi:non-ribosomal peptide synthetase component E (peptide arylation enzyme)